MPLYDYECEDCSLKEEHFESFDCKDERFCPICNQKMRRLFPNKTSFKLVYNNKKDVCDWSGNTTQYYRTYNEMKSQGKNVDLPD